MHGLVVEAGNKTDKIVITAPKIEQMATLFAKTWQRSPTSEELEGLIDDHVKEEILVRQALALGNDRDDTVIRRRLRQKMEFLNATEVEAIEATDADLQAYLDANPEAFRIDSTLAFQRVFASPQRRGQAIGQDAASILEVLLADPDADRSSLGDPTLLPPDLPLTTTMQIGQTFGAEFAEAVSRLPPRQRTGPVASTFGRHLVRVTERLPGRTPALEEVREAVAREWTNARRQQLEESRLAALLEGYSVIIESPAGPVAAQ